MFGIKQDNEKLLKKFHKEKGDRLKSAMLFYGYQSADRYLELIKEKLPATADLKDYRNALEKFSDGLGAYGVRLVPLRGKSQKIEGKSSIIYIRPKPGKKIRKKDLKILEKFGPWTLETIPFMPSQKEAVILIKKVGSKIVTQVYKKNKADLGSYQRKLSSVQGPKPTDKTVKGKVTTDMTEFGMAVEFGRNGQKPFPHWRPALRALAGQYEQNQITSMDEFNKTMSDPKYSDWEHYQPGNAKIATTEEIESYKKFMDSLRSLVKGI
jgi:hypothetical protein